MPDVSSSRNYRIKNNFELKRKRKERLKQLGLYP